LIKLLAKIGVKGISILPISEIGKHKLKNIIKFGILKITGVKVIDILPMSEIGKYRLKNRIKFIILKIKGAKVVSYKTSPRLFDGDDFSNAPSKKEDGTDDNV